MVGLTSALNVSTYKPRNKTAGLFYAAQSDFWVYEEARKGARSPPKKQKTQQKKKQRQETKSNHRQKANKKQKTENI